jgi:hypothetical protein
MQWNLEIFQAHRNLLNQEFFLTRIQELLFSQDLVGLE